MPPRPLPSQIARAESLPRLYSNNSTEPTALSVRQSQGDTVLALSNLLSSYHKRQAHTLYSNVKRLVEIEAKTPGHVGFLTLTFPDNVTSASEAYERFRSMNSHWLSSYPEIEHWVCTKERQKRGAWHYHLVVTLREDIRTGFDFSAIEKKDYSSASPYLRKVWSDLREAMKQYGFGRSELMPIASNPEAISRYVGKYISKHIGARSEDDKGVRLVSYSRGWVRNSIKMAWHNGNAIIWRWKLKAWAEQLGCTELYQLTAKLGTGWAYRFAKEIIETDWTEQPSQDIQPYQDRTLIEIETTRRVRHHAEIKDLIKARQHQLYNRAKEQKRITARNYLSTLTVPDGWSGIIPF